jgi:hypothetical protein
MENRSRPWRHDFRHEASPAVASAPESPHMRLVTTDVIDNMLTATAADSGGA